MILGRVLLLFAVVIWGWTFVATKVCLLYFDPLELLALRFVIALPVLLALIRLRRARLAVRAHLPRLLLGSAILTVHFVLQISGLRYTSATNSGWIIAVIPLVMAVLAYFLLGERVGPRTVAGIGLAAVGVAVLVSRGRLLETEWLRSVGDWLVLASAFTWALYTISIRDLARACDPLVVTAGVLLPATLVLVATAAPRADWGRYSSLPAEAIAALLFLGVLGTAAAQWFWQVGVAQVGATEAGVFLYLEPLATTALAVPYLGEPLGPSTLFGGSMVLAGVALAQRRSREANPAADPIA